MMLIARLTFLTPFYGVAIVSTWLSVRMVGPDAEARFMPVLADQVIGATWRTEDRACFRWTYTKERDPVLVRQDFTVERPDGIRYPVDELRPELGISSNASTTAPKGVRRTISECVVLKGAERTLDRFLIRGHKIYRPWHGLFDIDQPLLPVSIDSDTPNRPPAPSDDPGIAG